MQSTTKPADKTRPTAPEQWLEIARIRRDGGTQIREAIDQATVERYGEAFDEAAAADGEKWPFPPCDVYHDGRAYWLADGFHRLAAAEKRPGRTRALCTIHQGTREEAILHACGSNATHGLPRSNADKRRAVEALLRLETSREWSDRRVAEAARVGHHFVAKVRAEMPVLGARPRQDKQPEQTPVLGARPRQDQGQTPANPQQSTAPNGKKIGRDGRSYSPRPARKPTTASPSDGPPACPRTTSGNHAWVYDPDEKATVCAACHEPKPDEVATRQRPPAEPATCTCPTCNGRGTIDRDPDLPDSLASIADAWQEWKADRKARKHKLTAIGARRQIAFLVRLGPTKARQAIEASIMHGWTGLFDPDKSPKATKAPALTNRGKTAAGKVAKL